MFVVRLSAPKGIYDLFDAIPYVIERHPEVHFVLVGVAESDAMEPVIHADRICRLLDDENLRHRISERVRARAPLEFAIEVGCAKAAEGIKGAPGSASNARFERGAK